MLPAPADDGPAYLPPEPWPYRTLDVLSWLFLALGGLGVFFRFLERALPLADSTTPPA
jgi:hypothetical protein